MKNILKFGRVTKQVQFYNKRLKKAVWGLEKLSFFSWPSVDFILNILDKLIREVSKNGSFRDRLPDEFVGVLDGAFQLDGIHRFCESHRCQHWHEKWQSLELRDGHPYRRSGLWWRPPWNSSTEYGAVYIATSAEEKNIAQP